MIWDENQTRPMAVRRIRALLIAPQRYPEKASTPNSAGAGFVTEGTAKEKNILLKEQRECNTSRQTMMRTEVKDSHGIHVGAGGKVGEANGVTGGGLQLAGGRVFRGGAAKVGSAGRLFSAKTNDINKEETKGRLQNK